MYACLGSDSNSGRVPCRASEAGAEVEPDPISRRPEKPPPAPVREHEPAADEAAEVREVGDALLRAGDAEEQLERRVDQHEHPRLDRERHQQEEHAVVREVDRVGEQEAEHAARRAHGGIDLARERHHHELRDRGGHDADEVVRGVAARADHLLQRASEHVQREHVEEEVREPAVQEAVGDDLPELEAHLPAGRRRGAERPQGEGHEERGLLRLQQVDRDVGDDQCQGDGRHGCLRGGRIRRLQGGGNHRTRSSVGTRLG